MYTTITKEIDDPITHERIEFPCDICVSDAPPSHFTKIRALEHIMNNHRLTPQYGNASSGTVSFTRDPTFTFSNSSIEITMDDAIISELHPMCYYTYNDLTHQQKDLVNNIEKHAYDNGKTINEIRAEYGIQDQSYRKECEWYSQKPISLEKIQSVSMYIPWRIGESYMIECENTIPKYASFGSGFDIQDVHDEITYVKHFADTYNANFNVKSTYPYINEGYWKGTYIPLDYENLQRLSKGKDPYRVSTQPKIHPDNECMLLPSSDEKEFQRE